MACESRAIHEQRATSDLTIVSYVRIRKEKIVVPQPRDAATFSGAAADRHVFAKDVSITSNKLNMFAAKGVILRIAADHREWIESVPNDKLGRAIDDGMIMHDTALA